MDNKITNNEPFPVWSFWQTLAISLIVILVGNLFIQALVIAVNLLWVMFQAQFFTWDFQVMQTMMGNLFQKSAIQSEVILVSDLFSIIMIIYFVKKKCPDETAHYLGFNRIKILPLLFWMFVMVIVFYSMDFITGQAALDEPAYMKFMREMLKSESIGALTLMAGALVIVAPLFEEIMFRGFMYQGIVRSRLGAMGAIFIPAIGWSLMHVQYEWIWIFNVFFIGVLFGFARHVTHSIYIVVLMHALSNLLSFIDIMQG